MNRTGDDSTPAETRGRAFEQDRSLGMLGQSEADEPGDASP